MLNKVKSIIKKQIDDADIKEIGKTVMHICVPGTVGVEKINEIRLIVDPNSIEGMMWRHWFNVARKAILFDIDGATIAFEEFEDWVNDIKMKFEEGSET